MFLISPLATQSAIYESNAVPNSLCNCFIFRAWMCSFNVRVIEYKAKAVFFHNVTEQVMSMDNYNLFRPIYLLYIFLSQLIDETSLKEQAIHMPETFQC